jgi:hypothetical protein
LGSPTRRGAALCKLVLHSGRKKIVECVNRYQDAKCRLPRDTTPVQIRGRLNTERRQDDNGVWPPWSNVQRTNEQCRSEDLNSLRSMTSSHQFEHANQEQRFNQWRDNEERDYVSWIAAKVEWRSRPVQVSNTCPCSEEGVERDRIGAHDERKHDWRTTAR